MCELRYKTLCSKMDANNKGDMSQPPANNRTQQETLSRGLLDDEDRLSDFGSPKHGPTLSTSTSSFEALDPHDPNLSHLASLMFSHTSNYLQGELSAVLEDYTLLEQMNKATITKYADMRQIGGSVSRALKDLNEKYLALQPYLEQIDQIEDSVTKLEAAAYKLDAYSKRLEAKFKSLEKK
ncbi:biogenesis of lysosome-related organelles complex 1 subunit 2 isoform X1 [Cherax quadricarinatus]|nr:biogenesis of lysosome-related organelles complex 1 subunit 2-like isoform X1 [Cherax quadricarinatus]